MMQRGRLVGPLICCLETLCKIELLRLLVIRKLKFKVEKNQYRKFEIVCDNSFSLCDNKIIRERLLKHFTIPKFHLFKVTKGPLDNYHVFYGKKVI